MIVDIQRTRKGKWQAKVFHDDNWYDCGEHDREEDAVFACEAHPFKPFGERDITIF